MDKYGIKISREGKSVHSSDIRDFVIHSDYPAPKTTERATVQMTFPASNPGPIQVNINHGLGYAPFFFFMAELNSGRLYHIKGFRLIPVVGHSGYSYFVEAGSDSTKIFIKTTITQNFAASTPFTTVQTRDITYYIVIDEIT